MRLHPYRLISALAGVVLLAAAALKGHQLLTSPVPGSRALATLLVVAEWVLGMTLVSGLWLERMRLVAIAMFGVFSAVAGYRWWQGASSCGCFGRLVIPPVYTMMLDLIFLGAFLLFLPLHGRTTSVRKAALTGGAAFVTAALWVAGILSYTPATVDAQGQIAGDDSNVVVVPESWAGKRLPLRQEIPDSDMLVKGQWLVLFYHHDCPDCQQALRTLTARPLTGDVKLAVVEVPPYGELPPDTIKNREGLTSLKLNAERKWFLASPTLARVKDGVVESVFVQEQIVEKQKETPKLVELARLVSSEESTAAPAALPATVSAAKANPVVAASPASQPARDISNLHHDFGDVVVGQTYKYDLVLENPKSDRLPIKYTRGECKCLVIDRVPTGIPAKGTTTVHVSFTPDKPIAYSKRIVFLTDSPERPTIIFTATAKVQAGPTTR